MPNARKKPSEKFHHGDLRAALIEAGKKVVECDGFEAVSLSALAASLGVSQAACYRHFRNKEEFLAQIALDINISIGERLRQMVEAHPASSKLERVIDSYVTLGTQQGELYRFLFASPHLRGSAATSALYKAADSNFDIVLDAIDPSLEDMERRRITLRLMASLHGVVQFIQSGIVPTKIHVITAKEMVHDLVEDTKRTIRAARRSRNNG